MVRWKENVWGLIYVDKSSCGISIKLLIVFEKGILSLQFKVISMVPGVHRELQMKMPQRKDADASPKPVLSDRFKHQHISHWLGYCCQTLIFVIVATKIGYFKTFATKNKYFQTLQIEWMCPRTALLRQKYPRPAHQKKKDNRIELGQINFNRHHRPNFTSDSFFLLSNLYICIIDSTQFILVNSRVSL